MQVGAVFQPPNIGILVDLSTNCDPVTGQTKMFFGPFHPVQVGAGLGSKNLYLLVDFLATLQLLLTKL